MARTKYIEQTGHGSPPSCATRPLGVAGPWRGAASPSNRLVRVCLALAVAAGLLVSSAQADGSRHFPSGRWASNAISPEGEVSAAGAQWEAEHFDLFPIVTPGPKRKAYNPTAPFYSYIVMQYLYWLGLDPWASIQRYCEDHGLNFEDCFIHLSQDSVFYRKVISTDLSQQYRHEDRLAGCYRQAGAAWTDYTVQSYSNHYGTGNFTFCAAVGDYLYIGWYDKFTAVNFGIGVAAAGGWAGTWEYCSAAASNGTPLAWTALPIKSDGTNGMTQSGRVEFAVPPTWWASWRICAPYVPNWISSQYPTGAGRFYFVRIRCTSPGTTAPAFKDGSQSPGGVKLDTYYTDLGAHGTGGDRNVEYPGWDPANDPDGDGFAELVYAGTPANPNATALIRYQARYPFRVYSPSTAFQTNMGSATFQAAFTECCKDICQYPYSGYTYDGIFVDEAEPTWGVQSAWALVSGGAAIEYPNAATRPTEFAAAMAACFGAAKTGLNAIGKVIGGHNGAGYYPGVIDNSDYAFHGEFFIYTHSGIQTFVGGYRTFDHGHAAGKFKILQVQNTLGGWWGGDWMPRGNTLALATLYLYQNWALDYGSVNYGTYGSSGVDAATSKQWFPNAIQVDMGNPTGTVPSGKTAISGFNNGAYIYQAAVNPVTGNSAPVYARDYTKGLVLLRYRNDSDPNRDQATYGDGSAVTVTLPGTYQLVQYDGSLGPAITQIQLRVGEGAILVRSSADPPGVTATKSASVTQAPPTNVLTYTIACQNTSTQTWQNVVCADAIPAHTTYVPNSTKLNGTTVSPDPYANGQISVTIPSLAPGVTATVTFQVTIQ